MFYASSFPQISKNLQQNLINVVQCFCLHLCSDFSGKFRNYRVYHMAEIFWSSMSSGSYPYTFIVCIRLVHKTEIPTTHPSTHPPTHPHSVVMCEVMCEVKKGLRVDFIIEEREFEAWLADSYIDIKTRR